MLTATATLSSPAGAYRIRATDANDPNYVITHVDGSLDETLRSVAPDSTVRAYAIEEILLNAWTVSTVSHNTRFDALQGQ